jgi:hypothetical protein
VAFAAWASDGVVWLAAYVAAVAERSDWPASTHNCIMYKLKLEIGRQTGGATGLHDRTTGSVDRSKMSPTRLQRRIMVLSTGATQLKPQPAYNVSTFAAVYRCLFCSHATTSPLLAAAFSSTDACPATEDPVKFMQVRLTDRATVEG